MIRRTDPAFLTGRGTNSETFLSDLRKLIKKGKFFIVPDIS